MIEGPISPQLLSGHASFLKLSVQNAYQGAPPIHPISFHNPRRAVNQKHWACNGGVRGGGGRPAATRVFNAQPCGSFPEC